MSLTTALSQTARDVINYVITALDVMGTYITLYNGVHDVHNHSCKDLEVAFPHFKMGFENSLRLTN